MSHFVPFFFAAALFAADFTVIPCGNDTCQVAAIAAGPDHSIYAAGASPRPYVARIDTSGAVTSFWQLDTAVRAVRGITVDANSTVYIAGSATAKALKVKDALQPSSGPGTTGFIMALNSGGEIVFSTYFGGTAPASGNRTSTSTVNAITVDAAGAIYVTGETNSPDYPTTPGLPKYPVGGGYGANAGAFFAKLSPKAATLVYSGLLGGSGWACGCCSSCDMSQRWVSGDAIAIDAQGNAWIGGSSDVTNLSATANTWLETGMGGWVGRVTAVGDRLDFLTFLASSYYTLLASGAGDTGVSAIAVDGQGNAYVTGATANPEFQTTPGAFQTAFHGTAPKGTSWMAPREGFVIKFAPTGAVRYSTLIGGSGNDGVTGLVVSSDGTAYLAARIGSTDFPVTTGATRGGTGILVLDPTGSTMLYSTRLPGGLATSGLRMLDSGHVVLAGDTTLSSITLASAQPAFTALGNAAGDVADLVVAPGEMVTLYGDALGPAAALTAPMQPGSRLPLSLGEVRVWFDDVPARLVSIAQSQIIAVAPLGLVPGAKTRVRITRPVSQFASVSTAERLFDVVATHPIVFNGPEGSPFLNEDGTWNSYSNPARAGSVVTMWITGTGVPVPRDSHTPPEGLLASAPAAFDDACCRINSDLGNHPIEIVYSGAAPGFPPGTMQISFRAPASTLYYVRVGDSKNMVLCAAN